MTEEIKFLNLPNLPAHIKKSLLNYYQTIYLDMSKFEWMNRFHRHQVPIAAQEYGNQNTDIPKDLNEQLLSIYQPFFSHPIILLTSRTKNLLGIPSCTPPHCDRYRKLAINYLISAGGSNVKLILYNETRRDCNLTKAENCKYDEVTVKNSMIIPEEQWHQYDVQRFHSVENIETERYLLSILLSNNPNSEEFIKDYQNLIIENRTI